jgi:hypothetical protein
LNKSFARSFFAIEVKVKLFIGAKKMAQLRSKNVGDIDSSGKKQKHPFAIPHSECPYHNLTLDIINA